MTKLSTVHMILHIIFESELLCADSDDLLRGDSIVINYSLDSKFELFGGGLLISMRRIV